MKTNQILIDIYTLRLAGHTNILVSLNENREALWGEVIALPANQMQEAVEGLGWTTEGMMNASFFEEHIFDGKIHNFDTEAEALAAGFTIIVDDEAYAGDTPDVFRTLEEMQAKYTSIYGDANCDYRVMGTLATLRTYTVNGQEVEAISANDAIRTFASDQGYRTVGEPDIFEPIGQPQGGEWTDQDGTPYTVELGGLPVAEEADTSNLPTWDAGGMKLQRLLQHNTSGEKFGYAYDGDTQTEYWTDALNPQEVETLMAQGGEWEGVAAVDVSTLTNEQYAEHIAQYREIQQF